MNQRINNLCIKFIDDIDTILSFYNETITPRLTDKNESTLSELIFYRGYVRLEVFISDWFIECVNQNRGLFLNFRKNQIEQSIKSKFSEHDLEFLSYSIPHDLSFDKLCLSIDKNEKNVTFSDFGKMKDKASNWLDSQYQDKIDDIPQNTIKVLNAAKAIRDCIAHQSKKSFREMNGCISEIPTNSDLEFLSHHIQARTYIGSYLKKKKLNDTKKRIEIFMDEFKSFADKLKIN